MHRGPCGTFAPRSGRTHELTAHRDRFIFRCEAPRDPLPCDFLSDRESSQAHFSEQVSTAKLVL